MNQTQAIAKLRKIMGSKMGYRLNNKALDTEGQALAREKAQQALAKKKAVEEAMTARREELLRDPLYQSLSAEFHALTKEHALLRSQSLASKITVGVVSGMFFSVEADGDNWDEVVAKVSAKETA